VSLTPNASRILSVSGCVNEAYRRPMCSSSCAALTTLRRGVRRLKIVWRGAVLSAACVRRGVNDGRHFVVVFEERAELDEMAMMRMTLK